MFFCPLPVGKNYGPYYFEGKVDSDKYLHMLQYWFWKKHLDTAEYKNTKDGASPNTSNLVQDWLHNKFGKKFLS